MGRIGTFIFGFLVGAATIYGSLHYHVIRAQDGFHFVPKATSTLAETYVDVRSFGFREWTEHRQLALAIHNAGKSHVFQGVATNPFQNAVGNVFGSASDQQSQPSASPFPNSVGNIFGAANDQQSRAPQPSASPY